MNAKFPRPRESENDDLDNDDEARRVLVRSSATTKASSPE